MKVIEGIKKNETGLWKEVELEQAEIYFQKENSIDNYNCFRFWRHNYNCSEKYLNFFYELVRGWDDFSQSPYSLSLYDTRDIDWGYKPEGSLRFSDHWNFESRGKIHCKMEDETKNENYMLCKYENGVYKIIKDFGSKLDLYKLMEAYE